MLIAPPQVVVSKAALPTRGGGDRGAAGAGVATAAAVETGALEGAAFGVAVGLGALVGIGVAEAAGLIAADGDPVAVGVDIASAPVTVNITVVATAGEGGLSLPRALGNVAATAWSPAVAAGITNEKARVPSRVVWNSPSIVPPSHTRVPLEYGANPLPVTRTVAPLDPDAGARTSEAPPVDRKRTTTTARARIAEEMMIRSRSRLSMERGRPLAIRSSTDRLHQGGIPTAASHAGLRRSKRTMTAKATIRTTAHTFESGPSTSGGVSSDEESTPGSTGPSNEGAASEAPAVGCPVRAAVMRTYSLA